MRSLRMGCRILQEVNHHGADIDPVCTAVALYQLRCQLPIPTSHQHKAATSKDRGLHTVLHSCHMKDTTNTSFLWCNVPNLHILLYRTQVRLHWKSNSPAG